MLTVISKYGYYNYIIVIAVFRVVVVVIVILIIVYGVVVGGRVLYASRILYRKDPWYASQPLLCQTYNKY